MFRTHLLIPHKVVGSITLDEPRFSTLVKQHYAPGVDKYFYKTEPLLQVTKQYTADKVVHKVTAFQDVWLQEPGITIELQNFTPGMYIRGLKKNGKPRTGKYYMHQHNPHLSTVHFSRYEHWRFTAKLAVYKNDKLKSLWWSDDGFRQIMDGPSIDDEWVGCEVYDRGYNLEGTIKGLEFLKRWEAAGSYLNPLHVWLHFVAWTGGAAAVVNNKGQDVGAPGNTKLWQPRSWFRLDKNSTIKQTVHHAF